MNLPVIITPEAEEDLVQALAWHEQIRPGFGNKFERRFEEALSRIAQFPLAQPVVYRHTRRMLLLPFKYHVYYMIYNDRVYIAAVIHASRHPKVWKKRLRG